MQPRSPEISSSLGRIAIIGAGAVGCYYGGRLAQHGHEVHFLMRSDYEAVVREGLRITSYQGDVHLPVNAHKTAEDIGPCDLVIIAMKVTSNAALLDLIPPLLKEKTVLLTLQNGLGNEEFLAQHFGAERVLGGLCFVCINRIGPGQIHHIAQGRINMGEHTRTPLPRTQLIAEEFRRSLIDCHVVESLAAARWQKLVWNIPFNGLSIAAGGIDTEVILANPALETRVRALMVEIIQTAACLGHTLPPDLVETMISNTRTMAAYKPSSLIDYLDGKEVELEAIWGEPIRQAAQAGIAMPFVQELYDELKNRLAEKA
ncbi:2-dehydropantoate 2-reductase [Prosthecobacter fusiformis]|uniref:2-dehydropantoate 2-reductase n=1 Tax=Prosthecobacter fusiformis TaxID=48464 RepID=A0A4R7RQL9_9BACT|nr:2-dehydropantoate 2-reductase [Prosthecobacter fusiformis]TDU67158.1 2-dehydropantoate 2-reductase [Prosthecobacter fusiformis]